MDAFTPNLFSPEDPPEVLAPLPQGEWPRLGRGVMVHYATAPSVIGCILLATTDHGVCFLGIDDDDDRLVLALLHEYPAAIFQEAGRTAGAQLHRVTRSLASGKPYPSLPIDVPGTEWQRLVWSALCAVPFGETRTYGHIATQLGNPNSARAVGTACATNPVSILIPCHRALGATGSLHGFRWGLERKRALLLIEAGVKKPSI